MTMGRRGTKAQLSNRDKAWLALNYPKAPANKNRGSEDIGKLEDSLKALGIDADTLSKILNTGDVSERRFLYSQFVASHVLGKGMSIPKYLQAMFFNYRQRPTRILWEN